MNPTHNRQILLASRPTREATADNFALVESPMPEPGPGQVLIRTHYLSVDPYMRGRMSEQKSYAKPQPLGQVMVGGTVGQVIASRSAGLAEGDFVVGMGGWQEYYVADPSQPVVRKIDPTLIPLSAYLGPAGMPGVTAWYGLLEIIAPKAGETVVVSAASGAVGSVVGQLAKSRGVRVVGIAGGPEKCRYVIEELEFDACLDYRTFTDVSSLTAELGRACPDGIDGHFENVGGLILDAVMRLANPFARVAMCGMISGYNGRPIPLAAPQLILINRMKVQGFIISEHPTAWPPALAQLTGLIAAGRLKYRETIAQGLDAAPGAFLGLLESKNFGKQLVKLIP